MRSHSSFRGAPYQRLGFALAVIMLAACSHPNDSSVSTAAAGAGEVAGKGAKFTLPMCIEARCGVVDQDGRIVVPFESDAGSVIDFPMQETLLVNRTGEWQLLDAATMKPIKVVGQAVYEALPG